MRLEEQLSKLFVHLTKIYDERKNLEKANKLAKAVVSQFAYGLVFRKIENKRNLEKFIKRADKLGIGAVRRAARKNPFILSFKLIDQHFRTHISSDKQLSPLEKHFMEKHTSMSRQTRVNYANILLLMAASGATKSEVHNVVEGGYTTRLIQFYNKREEEYELPRYFRDSIENLNLGKGGGLSSKRRYRENQKKIVDGKIEDYKDMFEDSFPTPNSQHMRGVKLLYRP